MRGAQIYFSADPKLKRRTASGSVRTIRREIMELPWEYHRDVYMAGFECQSGTERIFAYIILRKNMSGWCKVKLINITDIDGDKVTMTDFDIAIHNEGNSEGSGHYMTPTYTGRLKGNALTVFMGGGDKWDAYLDDDYEWTGRCLSIMPDSDAESDIDTESDTDSESDCGDPTCPSSSSMPLQSLH